MDLNKNSKVIFDLPSKNIFQENTPDDPLKFYYKPIVGKLYCSRINRVLSLLNNNYDIVLEVGYGSGLMLPTLSKITNDLHGIDLDSDPIVVVEDLKKIGIKADLKQGSILGTDYQDNKFDLVVGVSVFEHIENLRQASLEIHRILKPGGQFLVGMPRVDFLMSKLFRIIGYKGINEHHVSNHKKMISSALFNEKFELVKFTKMPSFLPKFAGLYFGMLFKKI